MMKNYPLHLLLFLLLSVGSTATAFAQEQEEKKDKFKQQIQEFPFTEAVYLQQRRDVQATVSYFRTENSLQVGNALSMNLEYGLTDWLQVAAGLENELFKSEGNKYTLRRLELGTMFRLFHSPRQAVALSLEVELPLNKPYIASDDVEANKVSYAPALIYARQFGQTQLHLSGGAELEAKEVNWFYNAAAVYGTGRWHPVLEVTGTHQQEADWYAGTGIVLNHLHGWEVVAGVRRSLQYPDWDTSVKVLYEFNLGEE
ncbi:hypothetical protein [Pontibacter chitinilyticus]|uniref:hypothetical protein n=1 Tax=Pontibacter chitinilyticus TaxID=2674989 RepID=UPI00321B40DE